MNKKILTCILSLGVLVGLAGCGSSGSTEKYSDKVLADTTEGVNGWCIHGPNVLADGTQNGWNGKDDDVYQKSLMTATSIKEVSKISEAVADKLASKDVKALYVYEGLQLGVRSGGDTAKFKGEDGKLYVADNSYTFKVATLSIVEPEEEGDKYVWSEQTWIPDPHKARMEPLTNNIWAGPWQEAADDDGFTWSYNPVCRELGGTFTLIAAKFNIENIDNEPNFGFALIKTASSESAIPFEEYVAPTETTYSIIGAFGGYSWNTDVDMTKSGNVYTVTQAFADGDEFKVRKDHEWNGDWGYGALTNDSEPTLTDNNGNIVVHTAGNYYIIFTPGDTATLKVVLAAA